MSQYTRIRFRVRFRVGKFQISYGLGLHMSGGIGGTLTYCLRKNGDMSGVGVGGWGFSSAPPTPLGSSCDATNQSVEQTPPNTHRGSTLSRRAVTSTLSQRLLHTMTHSRQFSLLISMFVKCQDLAKKLSTD